MHWLIRYSGGREYRTYLQVVPPIVLLIILCNYNRTTSLAISSRRSASTCYDMLSLNILQMIRSRGPSMLPSRAWRRARLRDGIDKMKV
jgi:hypothetical protein